MMVWIRVVKEVGCGGVPRTTPAFLDVNGVPGPALRSGNRTGLVEESPSLVLGVLS